MLGFCVYILTIYFSTTVFTACGVKGAPGESAECVVLGVAFGPGHPFIRLQALGSGPVPTAVPNANFDTLRLLTTTPLRWPALSSPTSGKRAGGK